MLKFLQNGEEIGDIQFPITEVGTTSKMQIMIENVSIDPTHIIFYSEDGDMSIQEDYPRVLQAGESSQVTLLFAPSKNRPDSLKTKWGFREVDG